MTLDIDTSRAHPARMYDYYLGGKDHYPIDEAAAKRTITLVPEIVEVARANRDFMHRAARLLAQRGVTQFLDIGTGIPTEPNLHQVAQEVNPAARVVYVDYDPIVLRHAEALLQSTPEGSTHYIQADVRDPEKILEEAARTLDFDKPVALSLIALLHFISDEFRPYELVGQLLAPLAEGSHLVLSHVTGDFNPEGWAKAVELYRANGIPAQVRSQVECTGFFDGLDLLEPGVVPAPRWHPAAGQEEQGDMAVYVGVGRK